MFYARHTDHLQGIVELLDALSDTPVTSETHAWFIGRTRNASVLELRLAALVPDVQLITRSDGLAAWASRRHSATIVYWADDGALELTLDDDLEQAITTILNDIAPPGSSERPAASERRERSGDRLESKRYGQAVSEPVITRVVAIEELPPGSSATRRLIAEWSDGSQSEALAWFSDEWLVSEGDLIGLTRDEVRALAHIATASGSATIRAAPATSSRSSARRPQAIVEGSPDMRPATESSRRACSQRPVVVSRGSASAIASCGHQPTIRP